MRIVERAEDLDAAIAGAKREAAARVETIAAERGISAETLTAIKAGIFGIRDEGPKG